MCLRANCRRLERWQIAQTMGAGRPEAPSSATTEMRIARLRKKLGTAGGAAPCIKALHRFGY